MKAFIVDRYGSGDRVRSSDVPDPEMREDDALIQIHAAGVNQLDSKRPDASLRAGVREQPPQASMGRGIGARFRR